MTRKRISGVLFTLLAAGFGLAAAAEAQIPGTSGAVPASPPGRSDEPHMVIAGDRHDGAVRWAAARGATNWVSGVPDEMIEKLVAYTSAGAGVDAIAFAPNGGWTLIAGSSHFTRDIGGNYFDTLTGLIRAGREIRAVAFNPDGWATHHGFVIVHDQGIAAEHIPADLRSRLVDFTSAGDDIYDVELAPDGGWSFVTSTGHWTSGVGGPSPSYYETLTAMHDAGEALEAVAFFGDNRRWVIASDDSFRGAGVPAGLVGRLAGDFGLAGETWEAQSGSTRSGAPASTGWGLAQGEPVVTGVTGEREEVAEETRRLDFETAILQGVGLAEVADRPCHIRIYGQEPDGTERSLSVDCDRGQANGNAPRTARLDPDHAVTQLRMCPDDGFQPGLMGIHKRPKGVFLRGVMVRRDGTLDSVLAQDEFQRPNCAGVRSEWPWVICPEGHAASGVIANFNTENRRHWLNGLRLICRRVVPG